MVVNGLQHDGQTAKTFLAHEAQFVVHCLQVIDNGTLILAHLSAPRVVGHPVEAV